VGAALMTYNVLGGEDAKLTARTMALTGAAIGLMHSSFGLMLMHMVS
jgi:Flp pilus assembly protein protease CpaA